MSDYWQICERHARILRELEEEEEPTPRRSVEPQRAAALTDAMIDRLIDSKIDAARRALVEEINSAFDNLWQATNQSLDDLADKGRKAFASLREENTKLRGEVETLRGVRGNNVELIKRNQNVG